MKIIYRLLIAGSVLYSTESIGQSKALVNTSNSAHAKLSSVNMDAVQWTKGFWAERFRVCRDSMVPNMWSVYNDANLSHAFKNFEIAAGLDTGSHKGPSFHDGDFYKTLEAVASSFQLYYFCPSCEERSNPLTRNRLANSAGDCFVVPPRNDDTYFRNTVTIRKADCFVVPPCNDALCQAEPVEALLSFGTTTHQSFDKLRMTRMVVKQRTNSTSVRRNDDK